MLQLSIVSLIFLLLLQTTGAFSLPAPSALAKRLNERRPVILAADQLRSHKTLFEAYDSALRRYPAATKMLTSAVVAGIGDAVVQSMAKPRLPFEIRRCITFMLVGFFYIAPSSHVWFNFLETLQTPVELGKWGKTLYMLALDQTFGATIICSLFFFAFELVSYP